MRPPITGVLISRARQALSCAKKGEQKPTDRRVGNEGELNDSENCEKKKQKKNGKNLCNKAEE